MYECVQVLAWNIPSPAKLKESGDIYKVPSLELGVMTKDGGAWAFDASTESADMDGDCVYKVLHSVKFVNDLCIHVSVSEMTEVHEYFLKCHA